ncbi:MAG TPA: UrcA family protein [Alphaproteobacteria bacterium]|nr:UrcA family protein [Alphaproteobacteria bacterium]
MNNRLTACLALTLACAVSSPAVAEPNGEATLLVQYDDLDLSTPAGLKILDRRLKRAADQACLEASGPARGQQLDLPCIADALAAAHAQVSQAIALQRSGKSLAEAKPH